MKKTISIITIFILCFAISAGCTGKTENDSMSAPGSKSTVEEVSSFASNERDSAGDSAANGNQASESAGSASSQASSFAEPETGAQAPAASSAEPTSQTPPSAPAATAPQADASSDSDPVQPSAGNEAAVLDTTVADSTPETQNVSPPASTPAQSPETFPPGSTAEQSDTSSADDPIVLTVTGPGVSGESIWTLGDLQSIAEGYREVTYSTTNNWPRYGYVTAHGISLPYLLRLAGIRDSAASFKLTASDGYYVVVTFDQMFGVMYSYENHGPAGSAGAVPVEPIIAWEWGEGSAGSADIRQENIRSFFGQKGAKEVNTSAFVTDICRIEALTEPPGAWDAPGASIADGSVVPEGSTLEIMYDRMDSVRIYYTLDGSYPDYDSAVYNPSASFFQPELTIPVTLTESVTIKAFAAGYGKDASDVAVFRYTVEK